MVMMKKVLCYLQFNKYRKLKTPKMSYIFYKTLVLFIICKEFGSNDEEIFKEEESIKILKFLGLIKAE